MAVGFAIATHSAVRLLLTAALWYTFGSAIRLRRRSVARYFSRISSKFWPRELWQWSLSYPPVFCQLQEASETADPHEQCHRCNGWTIEMTTRTIPWQKRCDQPRALFKIRCDDHLDESGSTMLGGSKLGRLCSSISFSLCSRSHCARDEISFRFAVFPLPPSMSSLLLGSMGQ
jgi:hypothetical protein